MSAYLRRSMIRAGRRAKSLKPSGYPPFYWPTEYKVVTQAFGINADYYGKFGLPGHEGIDMRARNDTPIYAVWRGKVDMVYPSPEGHAYGFHVRIRHMIKKRLFSGKVIMVRYQSIYAHFLRLPVVVVGERVKRGQIVGYANSTGNSTASHLHLSLKQYNGPVPVTEMQFDNNGNNKWIKWNFVDPTPFFKELRDGYK